jgi:endonuclease/exonuclease/phosphatase family metal-dependent hydrolase
VLRILSLLLLGTLAFSVEGTEAAAVGDRVLLVERDIHIPAHPAPGDGAVPFRFVGGSEALVLAIDAPTGWHQLRGEMLEGGTAEGWITARFIASVLENTAGVPGELPPELAWCPKLGSPEPHASGRLRIATWNLENLHAQDGQATFEGGDPSVRRSATDYLRIRCYVRMIDPDILAVQEVDGPEALTRVVDPEVYEVHVDERPKPAGMNGRQNTGFAFKKGLAVTIRPSLTELDVSNGSLRYGARLDLAHRGQTIRFLTVHLKSGCFDPTQSGSACTTLLRQVPVLEGWIDQAADEDMPFVVLGDFNRRFNLPGEPIWAELDDGVPANADLLNVTTDRPLSCRDNSFTQFIDHILLDLRVQALLDPASFRQVTYRQEDKAVWNQISDHCPLVTELFLP